MTTTILLTPLRKNISEGLYLLQLLIQMSTGNHHFFHQITISPELHRSQNASKNPPKRSKKMVKKIKSLLLSVIILLIAATMHNHNKSNNSLSMYTNPSMSSILSSNLCLFNKAMIICREVQVNMTQHLSSEMDLQQVETSNRSYSKTLNLAHHLLTKASRSKQALLHQL